MTDGFTPEMIEMERIRVAQIVAEHKSMMAGTATPQQMEMIMQYESIIVISWVAVAICVGLLGFLGWLLYRNVS